VPVALWCEEHSRQHHEENFLVHVLLHVGYFNYQCQQTDGSGEFCRKPAYSSCDLCLNANLCSMHRCGHNQTGTEFLDHIDEFNGYKPFSPVLRVRDESRRELCRYRTDHVRTTYAIECWTLHGPVKVEFSCELCSCHSNNYSLLSSLITNRIWPTSPAGPFKRAFMANVLQCKVEWAEMGILVPVSDQAFVKMLLFRAAKYHFNDLVSETIIVKEFREVLKRYAFIVGQAYVLSFIDGTKDNPRKTECYYCPPIKSRAKMQIAGDGMMSAHQKYVCLQ